MVTLKMFHAVCRQVVEHDATDNYSKAVAQVGLGLWTQADAMRQANVLLCNVCDMPGWAAQRKILKRLLSEARR